MPSKKNKWNTDKIIINITYIVFDKCSVVFGIPGKMGNGCASVLKTQWSSGIVESSENKR